jgi:hypothetical protein
MISLMSIRTVAVTTHNTDVRVSVNCLKMSYSIDRYTIIGYTNGEERV